MQEGTQQEDAAPLDFERPLHYHKEKEKLINFKEIMRGLKNNSATLWGQNMKTRLDPNRERMRINNNK